MYLNRCTATTDSKPQCCGTRTICHRGLQARIVGRLGTDRDCQRQRRTKSVHVTSPRSGFSHRWRISWAPANGVPAQGATPETGTACARAAALELPIRHVKCMHDAGFGGSCRWRFAGPASGCFSGRRARAHTRVNAGAACPGRYAIRKHLVPTGSNRARRRR